MTFKRIATLSVAGAMTALLATQPAGAGGDAKRFGEVETWAGQYSINIVTAMTLPNGVDTEIVERIKGSVSLTRASDDPTGRQLDWKGTSQIDVSMTGKKLMNMGEMSSDIRGSGGDNGNGEASLSIDAAAGTYTLKLGKLRYEGEWSGTVRAGDQVTPYNEMQRRTVRPQVKKRPLPASGLAIRDSGTVENEAGMGTITKTFQIALNTEMDEPKVVTNAPKCKCVYPARDNKAKETLIVQARVENGEGGEFVSFRVEPEGKKAEWRESLQDTEADLYLDFDQKTGPVTVTAIYEKDGETYESKSQRIQFCFIEEMEFKHNDELTDKKDLSFDTGGRFTVEANALVTINGKTAASADVTWEMREIGDGQGKKFDEVGGRVRAEFIEKMPVGNSSFGPNELTLKPNNADCDCQQKREMRAFFTADSKDHPGKGSGATPNWFYYWMQTSASGGLHAEYVPTLTAKGWGGSSLSVAGQYDYTSDTVYLSDNIIAKVCAARTPMYGGGSSEHIDCFAEIIRHENVHKTERWAWWGKWNELDPTVLNATALHGYDADGDLVPNWVEEELAGSRGCSTFDPTSCSGRPIDSLMDVEMNAYNVGWTWQRHAADPEDWACGYSEQWTGATCY